ncbi:MAG: LacI family transcriptional regulator [Sphaerochaeta sp.]|jgi:DNA-binding LacI/PurR family transcriptional regulator|nr:LacI family transcriptional regulator [Sphaerochaeta sp.]
MKITLKDIANDVGVSISTVSRVVNSRNPNAASPEIQQRIWESVRNSGYIPNTKSRKNYTILDQNSDTQSSVNVIACIFARNNLNVGDNAYFTGMARCFERTALELNYSTQNHFTAVELHEKNIEAMSRQHLDGVLVIGRHDKVLIEKLSKFVKHIVYAGLARPAADTYDSVVCDRYAIGTTAARYLMDLGHRKIGYIGEIDNEITFDGFSIELKANGLDLTQNSVINLYASMENGYIGMKKLLDSKNHPTAVFCMNDYVAVGAMRAVHESGINCPKEISILGVDDIEAAAYTTPKLTTIHTPMEELGSIASKILIDRIEGGHTINMKVQLPFHIIERESCISIK